MENLFGKGLSAYPSNWTGRPNDFALIELGSYVEIIRGSYADLHGVVTYLEQSYAWVRLDGDSYDLRFRLELLARIE